MRIIVITDSNTVPEAPVCTFLEALAGLGCTIEIAGLTDADKLTELLSKKRVPCSLCNVVRVDTTNLDNTVATHKDGIVTVIEKPVKSTRKHAGGRPKGSKNKKHLAQPQPGKKLSVAAQKAVIAETIAATRLTANPIAAGPEERVKAAQVALSEGVWE